MSYFVSTVIWPIVTSYYPWWLLFWHMLFFSLLGPLHPRVARIPDRQRKQSTKRPSDNNSERAFPNNQKVVTVEKAGGIYTPNPRGTFTLLPMHFYLISALSGLLIGLYSSTPNTITSIPTPISLMSVLSKALFGLCTRFSVEEPFMPRSFSKS